MESNVEKYIKKHTRKCSNITGINGDNRVSMPCFIGNRRKEVEK